MHGLGQIVVFARQIAFFIHDEFQQCSGLSHTSFQELSGDVGSCLACHLRSVGLLSFLFGIDTVSPCCI